MTRKELGSKGFGGIHRCGDHPPHHQEAAKVGRGILGISQICWRLHWQKNKSKQHRQVSSKNHESSEGGEITKDIVVDSGDLIHMAGELVFRHFDRSE